MSNFPASRASWSDVARLCRRICVLREHARTDEAAQVEHGPLAELLSAMRATGEAEATIKARLEEIFAVEAERVANAAVLAELLAPLLTERAPAFVASATRPVPAPVAPVRTATTPAAPPPAPKRPVGIADFIDEMIAQESRDPPASHRRAS